MPEYIPAYRKSPPLTIENPWARLAALGPIPAYAVQHDDLLVLDELFCKIVTVDRRLILWEREQEPEPRLRVASSLKELD